MMGRATKLAIDDGPKAVRMPLRRWPELTKEDRRARDAVDDAPPGEVDSPSGRFIREFEEAVSEAHGGAHVVGLSSGTDALTLGMQVCGLEGKIVYVAALGFGTPTAAASAGGQVWACDIDPRTYNLDPNVLRERLDPGTRAVAVTHLGGTMADMDAVEAVMAARAPGAVLIEDACHALGSTYKGRHAGTIGTFGAFSLAPQKPITGLGGGILITHDADLADEVRERACHGEQRLPLGPGQVSAHVVHGPGRNSRIHPWAAAVARSQLDRLPAYLDTANANAKILTAGLDPIPGVTAPHVPDDTTTTHHLYRIMLDPVTLGWSGSQTELRDRVISAYRAEGVPAGVYGLVPYSDMPAFRRPGLRAPVAADVAALSIVLGRYPHPLQVQTANVMADWVRASEKIFEQMPRVLAAPYKPLDIVPPLS